MAITTAQAVQLAGAAARGGLRATGDLFRAIINGDLPLRISGTEVTATAAELNQYTLPLFISDGSADAVYYMTCPHAGAITKIETVINGAVSSANITVTARIGNTAMTDGVVTIATSGSAAGDQDSATPTAGNVVTAGQAINLVVAGGGSGGAPSIYIVVTITR